MNFTEETNISSYIDFVLCKGHSKKNDKDYFVLCFKIDNFYYPIKFLTYKQYDELRKEL